MEPRFNVLRHPLDSMDNHIIKAWNDGVVFEDKAVQQLMNVVGMPFIKPYVAAMPDTHWGMGCTVGSVIPSVGAIMPAAVGVDIGCGMMACRTNLPSECIVGNQSELQAYFNIISKVVPHGRTNNGGDGDRGAWHNVPEDIHEAWHALWYDNIIGSGFTVFDRHKGSLSKNAEKHLGTLGTGNHFIELSKDEEDRIWIVLHSGSRGFGNRIGTYFTNLAKQKCEQWFVQLPDKDLAYFPQYSEEYADYLKTLHFAQKYAWRNREIMMARLISAFGVAVDQTVHCHHNYMAEETHFGKKVLLTRKGAVRAGINDYVIIPGSMGARTYIARGLGSVHSFNSCSHGAGRAMSRTQAIKQFSVEDHVRATEGVVCWKGREVLDETPSAYKDIDAVMNAQSDLVEPVHILKQLVCVKGLGE